MKTVFFTLAISAIALVGTPDAHAQLASQIGNSHLNWTNATQVTIDSQDPWAVSGLLRDSGLAVRQVGFFTPGLLGSGVPNRWTGVADTGLANTFAVLHDYNVLASPFGQWAGYIDIITPLFGITHRQIANFFTWSSSGAARVPQVSSFTNFISSVFQTTHQASSYGNGTAPFTATNDGYESVPAGFPELPGNTIHVACGTLKAHDTLRPAQGWFFSCNGRYGMALSSNGQLALISLPPGGVPSVLATWGSAGPISNNYAMVVQPDGEVVVYRSDWTRHFVAGTPGNLGAKLHLTNEGNVFIQ